ncbi:MAG TPA: hypothetical protein PLC18_13005, partial [Sediminibacterium sp.]|nr:hypothetical protein [Sediminibacterium sp.]
MLRKKIAIFFFALIQIILFGHGVILHHHSVDEHSSHHQHGSQSKEEKSPNNSPFDIAFSSLQHAGEQVVFNLNITQDFSLIKKGSSLFYTLIACFDFSNVY